MFYRPAASAMNVLLGQKSAAFDNISDVLHHRLEGSGWYREGAAGSCTETPYHVAWAVADWMLQSWRRTPAGEPVLDFFPGFDDAVPLATPYAAAPARVANASFFRLRVAGANCSHLLADSLGTLFRAAGLPPRFHWGPEFWGSTFVERAEAEDDEGGGGGGGGARA